MNIDSTSFLKNFFAGIPFFFVHIPQIYMFFLFPAFYPPNSSNNIICSALSVILGKKKKKKFFWAWIFHPFSVSPHLIFYRHLFLLHIIWMMKQKKLGIPSSPSRFFKNIVSSSMPLSYDSNINILEDVV